MPSGKEATVSVLDIMCKDRNDEAEEHRRKRDQYADEARNWALRRDQYRERSKDAQREANELIPDRDAWNAKVREIKERRDKAHAEAAEYKGKDKEKFEAARQVGNAIHEELLAAVEEGHRVNDRISALYEEHRVDRILSQAAHKKFVECRKAADAEHDAYLKTRKSVRGLRAEYSKDPEQPGSEYRCPKGRKGQEAIARMNEHHAPLVDWAMGFIPGIEPDDILDIGCGGGMLIGKLHRKYPCARLHGVDISELSVSSTKANNRDIWNLDIRQASVSDLPFPDGSFQLITAVETYFFWPDLANDLKSAARCLAPGGVLMVVAESYPHPGLDGKSRQEIADYGMNIVGNDAMVSMLEAAGLKVRYHVRPENSWVTFIAIKR